MYRPLPNGLTIKKSKVQGLGLFATKQFNAHVVLGMSHVMNKNFPHGSIRTALGAFYNHSDKPNCEKVELKSTNYTKYNLVAIKNIKAWEELTVKYTFYNLK